MNSIPDWWANTRSGLKAYGGNDWPRDREPGANVPVLSGVVRIQIEILVIERAIVGGLIPEVLLRLGEPAERISRANYGLAAPSVSGEPVLEAGRPGDAESKAAE